MQVLHQTLVVVSCCKWMQRKDPEITNNETIHILTFRAHFKISALLFPSSGNHRMIHKKGGRILNFIITHYAEIDLFYLRSSITSSLDGAPRERSSRKVHAFERMSDRLPPGNLRFIVSYSRQILVSGREGQYSNCPCVTCITSSLPSISSGKLLLRPLRSVHPICLLYWHCISTL